MPLYEYQCDVCSTRFERIRKFSDPPLETCPSCGGAVRKLFSSPAIQFKGSGWYITDYAKKSSSSESNKDSSTPASTSTDSSSSGPAATTNDKSTGSEKSGGSSGSNSGS